MVAESAWVVVERSLVEAKATLDEALTQAASLKSMCNRSAVVVVADAEAKLTKNCQTKRPTCRAG